MIKTFINNYFGFNKQQRNGLVVLLCISFALLLARITYPTFIKPAQIEIKNLPLIERQLDSASKSKPLFEKRFENKKEAVLSAFDPNSVSQEQLMAMGFREKTAKTFIKYRNKGVVFKEKRDLKKIYGISGELYARIEPYIKFEPRAKNFSREKQEEPAAKEKNKQRLFPQKIIELNSCDSVAIISLSGIGPSYARRILKYRSSLGGFTSVDQLTEVYGFPEDVLEKVRPFLTVDASNIKKINLNTADFKTVNRHPYLSYELTKSIFNWRRKTNITATNLKTILNDDVLYQKLLPYLVFE